MEWRKTEEPGEIVITKKNEEIIRRHGNMSEESGKMLARISPYFAFTLPPGNVARYPIPFFSKMHKIKEELPKPKNVRTFEKKPQAQTRPRS